jgi:catechol 2,3-dioxygenase-like lactoylglutathione lyase family enzyme
MHVVLAVTDVDRAYAFYREVFGWESHLEWPGEYTELVLSDDDRLGLYRRDGWARSAGAEPAELNGEVSTAYLYVLVDDLEGTLKRLGEAGARPLSPRQPRTWGDEAAYFADPDGNVVAVAARLPQ